MLVYQIFAAYNAGDEHILNTYDLTTEEGVAAYIETMKSSASLGGYIRNDVEVLAQNHIITLSTCTDRSDERYLVQAVLINDEFEENFESEIPDNPELETANELQTDELTGIPEE